MSLHPIWERLSPHFLDDSDNGHQLDKLGNNFWTTLWCRELGCHRGGHCPSTASIWSCFLHWLTWQKSLPLTVKIDITTATGMHYSSRRYQESGGLGGCRSHPGLCEGLCSHSVHHSYSMSENFAGGFPEPSIVVSGGVGSSQRGVLGSLS